jgi:hypothetical protein
MKPPIMIVAPFGIIAMASFAETAFIGTAPYLPVILLSRTP